MNQYKSGWLTKLAARGALVLLWAAPCYGQTATLAARKIASLQVTQITLAPLQAHGQPVSYPNGPCCMITVSIMPLDDQRNYIPGYPQLALTMQAKSREEALEAVKPTISGILDNYRQALDHIEFTNSPADRH